MKKDGKGIVKPKSSKRQSQTDNRDDRGGEDISPDRSRIGAWEGGLDSTENMALKSMSHKKMLQSGLDNDYSKGLQVPRLTDMEDELYKSKTSKREASLHNSSFVSLRGPSEPIGKKRRRVILAVMAVVKFWRILEHIKQYGTSSNLYNIAFRSRKSVKKSIFPIAKGSSQVKVKTKLFLLFHPNSTFLTFWNILLLFFVFYVLSFMPYLTVFQQGDSTIQDGFENFMDVCFLLDLAFNFFTAIYTPKGE